MADLTVNSLSITPGTQWPVDGSNGVLAARTQVGIAYDVADRVAFAYQPSLPSSSSSQSWSGSVSVQSDFSP